MLAMLLYVFDNVYVALCCVYSAACYSTLLYLFLLLDFARGCFILPMLFDAAICLSHSFDVARSCCFVVCLSLRCVGHVALFFERLFYTALVCSM